ncbi:MAG: hypothetical protein Q3962_09015 [Corynebacterium sp.]|nr:hypothetical protein [Corynebacterium sp.]
MSAIKWRFGAAVLGCLGALTLASCGTQAPYETGAIAQGGVEDTLYVPETDFHLESCAMNPTIPTKPGYEEWVAGDGNTWAMIKVAITSRSEKQSYNVLRYIRATANYKRADGDTEYLTNQGEVHQLAGNPSIDIEDNLTPGRTIDVTFAFKVPSDATMTKFNIRNEWFNSKAYAEFDLPAGYCAPANG